MKMYRTCKYNVDIEEIEVERSTEARVTYHSTGMRKPLTVARVSVYQRWFSTRAEAREYLLQRTREELAKLKSEVEICESRIAQLSKGDRA
jgi:hypothetical protein